MIARTTSTNEYVYFLGHCDEQIVRPRLLQKQRTACWTVGIKMIVCCTPAAVTRSRSEVKFLEFRTAFLDMPIPLQCVCCEVMAKEMTI